MREPEITRLAVEVVGAARPVVAVLVRAVRLSLVHFFGHVVERTDRDVADEARHGGVDALDEGRGGARLSRPVRRAQLTYESFPDEASLPASNAVVNDEC